jgi:nitroimidazol reductase NimA-like FMN-containing flavoprotein (pyridoxamine 5'-phosphate oxidase superfamily)
VSESGPRRFTAMSESQCRDLLQTHHVGRIAWQAADGQQILPVTYAWYDDSLVFRTSPYGLLSELVRPTDVALEIDELNEDRRTGWSVMVQGRAQAVAEPANLVELWAIDGLVPWAPGVRTLFIQVVPRRTTGRVLQGRDRDAESDDDAGIRA